MVSWIPEAILVRLFAGVGITVNGAAIPPRPRLEPIVTRVTKASCVQWYQGATVFGTPDPAPEGFLLVEADIGFGATSGTVIPSK